MLNPIKSLFSYLNKNANSVKPNEIDMTEEVNSSPDNEGESYDDPLTDPLALDIEVELDPVQENENVHNNGDTKSAIEGSLDNTTIEEIIFVDIEKLKNCNNRLVDDEEQENNEDYDEEDVGPSNSKEISHYVEKSDINGNENHHHHRHHHNNVDCESHETELDVGKSPSSVVDGITSSSSYESNHKSDKESEKTSTTLDKSADNSSVISVINSEPENDEITDISELRSDGSDSGLGSEILHSVSAIEKNLKLLTPAKSSLKRRSNDNESHHEEPKKPRHSINFSDITVYYFPRCQGFSCVPTQGGSSLGMTSKHAYKRVFTLAEHAIEQRRLNRLKLAGELNESLSSSDESKSDDEISENSFSEGDNDAYGFLQPLTARQRRMLLKTAGVKKIDTLEKDDCRQLRVSREVCGCTCRGYCDPDTCECSQAGIKCQVDRLKPHEFPCGCNRDGCGNVNGRVEFNPSRVKTHFIHTIMRLELEKRQEMSDEGTSSTSPNIIQNHPKWWSQMRLQQTSTSSNPNNCNYSNYAYSPSSSSTSPYSTIPNKSQHSTVTSPNIVTQESLDLHYAYRDDYINNPINSDNTSSFLTSANGHDYYSPYYLTNVSTTPNSHYQSGYQQQNIHHLPYYTNSSDCQYSNYSATNGSNRYHLKNDPTTALDINGFTSYNNSPNNTVSVIQNQQQSSRLSYQQNGVADGTDDIIVEQLPAIESFETSLTQSSPLATTSTSSTTVDSNVENSNQYQESNENLCEIIKKSIVETVTA